MTELLILLLFVASADRTLTAGFLFPLQATKTDRLKLETRNIVKVWQALSSTSSEEPRPTLDWSALQTQESDEDDDDSPIRAVRDTKWNDGMTTPSGSSDERSNIPSTGISVSDEMEQSEKDRFVTTLVPIEELPGVAQLVSSPLVKYSFEPVRYLVPLLELPNEHLTKTKRRKANSGDSTTNDDKDSSDKSSPKATDYVMVDVPPYSPVLVNQMQSFMGPSSRLVAILITSRDAIHYDEAPAMYSSRRSDLQFWKQAYPHVSIIGYRLDIPRDCRSQVTQVVDGYGPFAAEVTSNTGATPNVTFVETGRPLKIVEWDHDVAQKILAGKELPPDDEEVVAEDEYSPEAIRQREENKSILAIYTPGHSFGSLSFVFPQSKLLFSGFTLPVEDPRQDDDGGDDNVGTGPALDCRGYVTTSRAGLARQMESARTLIRNYSDRFEVILPSRGDPMFLDHISTPAQRANVLLSIVDQYDRIGKIYEQLGITSSDSDGDFQP